jgi:hypothetical protein
MMMTTLEQLLNYRQMETEARVERMVELSTKYDRLTDWHIALTGMLLIYPHAAQRRLARIGKRLDALYAEMSDL